MQRLCVYIPYILILFFLTGCGQETIERGAGELLYRAAGADALTSPAPSDETSAQNTPSPTPSPSPANGPADNMNDLEPEYGEPETTPDLNPIPSPDLTLPPADPGGINAPVHPQAWSITPRAGGIPPTGTQTAAFLHPFSAFYRGAELPQIFLTFELIYEAGYTETLLDVLQAYNVPAAFFVTLPYFLHNDDIILRIIAEGHVVGLRSHQPLTDMTDEDISEALMYPRRIFNETFGRAADPFFRPALGGYNEHTLQKTRHYGFFTIFWSALHDEWIHVANYAHPGMVLALPGINADNIARLPDVLDTLRDAGFIFASLYDLI